jgi:hypothetical protein
LEEERSTTRKSIYSLLELCCTKSWIWKRPGLACHLWKFETESIIKSNDPRSPCSGRHDCETCSSRHGQMYRMHDYPWNMSTRYFVNSSRQDLTVNVELECSRLLRRCIHDWKSWALLVNIHSRLGRPLNARCVASAVASSTTTTIYSYRLLDDLVEVNNA